MAGLRRLRDYACEGLSFRSSIFSDKKFYSVVSRNQAGSVAEIRSSHSSATLSKSFMPKFLSSRYRSDAMLSTLQLLRIALALLDGIRKANNTTLIDEIIADVSNIKVDKNTGFAATSNDEIVPVTP